MNLLFLAPASHILQEDLQFDFELFLLSLVISWTVVSETLFLRNLFVIWSTPLVAIFCLQIKDELPIAGFLSLCSLEEAVN